MIPLVVTAGLAGTRLTRAWLHETIGEPLRGPIEDWTAVEYESSPGDDGTVDVVLADSPTMLNVKAKVEELVTCPHCIGFWMTLGCVLAYQWRPTRPLVVALAGATILSAFADHYPGFDPDEADED